MPTPRWRPALVAAVALAALGPTALPSRAGYPEVCYAAVEGVGGRLLVSAPAGRDAELTRLVARLGGSVSDRYAPLGMREAAFASSAERDAALVALQRTPWVSWAEPTGAVGVHRSANDPQFRRQWGLHRINAPKAWDVEVGSRSAVTVAVIDTGVDLQHPDLKGKLVAGVDVVNGDDQPHDDHSHGTHVAGIIAAATNNRVGIAGVSWGAKVMPVKVLGKEGGGTTCDVAVGIVEAAQRKAHVLNLSLGMAGSVCPVVMRLAVEYATRSGALVVASSGNDGLVGAPESAPANCPGVLGVGATDRRDDPAIFSSFGPTVDVSAPGQDILSTIIDPQSGQHTYAQYSGTSMAAPHVAGLAALVKARHPDFTPEQVAARIVATSDDLGPRGRDDFYGAGRINAARALGAR